MLEVLGNSCCQSWNIGDLDGVTTNYVKLIFLSLICGDTSRIHKTTIRTKIIPQIKFICYFTVYYCDNMGKIMEKQVLWKSNNHNHCKR